MGGLQTLVVRQVGGKRATVTSPNKQMHLCALSRAQATLPRTHRRSKIHTRVCSHIHAYTHIVLKCTRDLSSSGGMRHSDVEMTVRKEKVWYPLPVLHRQEAEMGFAGTTPTRKTIF